MAQIGPNGDVLKRNCNCTYSELKNSSSTGQYGPFSREPKAVLAETIGALRLDTISDVTTQARISARVNKAESGALGDTKAVGESVIEMRMHFGKGYRAYFAFDGDKVIILLCGGDKSNQKADIAQAKRYWKDYQERTK